MIRNIVEKAKVGMKMSEEVLVDMLLYDARIAIILAVVILIVVVIIMVIIRKVFKKISEKKRANAPIYSVEVVCTKLAKVDDDPSFKGKIKLLLGLYDEYQFETPTGEIFSWHDIPQFENLSEIDVGTKGLLIYNDWKAISFKVEEPDITDEETPDDPKINEETPNDPKVVMISDDELGNQMMDDLMKNGVKNFNFFSLTNLQKYNWETKKSELLFINRNGEINEEAETIERHLFSIGEVVKDADLFIILCTNLEDDKAFAIAKAAKSHKILKFGIVTQPENISGNFEKMVDAFASTNAQVLNRWLLNLSKSLDSRNQNIIPLKIEDIQATLGIRNVIIGVTDYKENIYIEEIKRIFLYQEQLEIATVLLNLSAGMKVSLWDVNEIMEGFRDVSESELNILYGVRLDPSLGENEVEISYMIHYWDTK